MSSPTPLSHPKQRINSADVEGFDSLSELALDLRSSWNHATDEVWRKLDPALWEFTHNPWVVLQTVSRKKLQRVLAEPAFRKKVDDLVQARRNSAQAPAWFQKKSPARRAERCGVLQHGVHVERGVAHLFGRPG